MGPRGPPGPSGAPVSLFIHHHKTLLYFSLFKVKTTRKIVLKHKTLLCLKKKKLPQGPQGFQGGPGEAGEPGPAVSII